MLLPQFLENVIFGRLFCKTCLEPPGVLSEEGEDGGGGGGGENTNPGSGTVVVGGSALEPGSVSDGEVLTRGAGTPVGIASLVEEDVLLVAGVSTAGDGLFSPSNWPSRIFDGAHMSISRSKFIGVWVLTSPKLKSLPGSMLRNAVRRMVSGAHANCLSLAIHLAVGEFKPSLDLKPAG